MHLSINVIFLVNEFYIILSEWVTFCHNNMSNGKPLQSTLITHNTHNFIVCNLYGYVNGFDVSIWTLLMTTHMNLAFDKRIIEMKK